MVNWDMIGAMIMPNVCGWGTALISSTNENGVDWYKTIKKPNWNPPEWVFGTAWVTLYTGMGYASYMVYEDCGGYTDKAMLPLALYGGQLLLNWTWLPVFFKLHKIGLALFHILVLDGAAAACTFSFFQINPKTAYFMLPYLGWLTFATCLNYSYWKLNSYKAKKES